MKRSLIDLPAVFPFITRLTVRITEVNYGRHLGNDRLLGLLHEARLRFLAQWSFTELDAGGCGLIMLSAEVQFLAQAGYGDELEIGVGFLDAGRADFTLGYAVRRVSDGVEIARARTAMAFFDYTRGRPTRMPRDFSSIALAGLPMPERFERQ